MKTIGIIGGLSWESRAVYYRLINEKVRDDLGGLHAAKLLLLPSKSISASSPQPGPEARMA